MHELNYLYQRMMDEVKEAKEYAQKALGCKKQHPTKSTEYIQIATNKLTIVDSLHKIALDELKKIKQDTSLITPTQETKELWNIAHENAVKEYNDVRALITSYKQG